MTAFAFEQNALDIRTMRIRSNGDAIRTRQRIEAVVGAIDGSSGARPRELLVVRRVAPLAAFKLDPSDSARAFRSAVEAQLRHRAETARRPWLHADAAWADAVLFADETELVACLVRDWLRGWVAERWWWRTVLGNLSAHEWLRQHVVPRGELLVPALALLAARSDAVLWVQQFDDPDAAQALDAIQRAHAVPRPDASSRAPPSRRPNGDRNEARRPQDHGHTQVTRVAFERLVATVPEVRAPALSASQRRLLALALTLPRAPTWARSADFAAACALLEDADPPPDTPARRITSTSRLVDGPVGRAKDSPIAQRDQPQTTPVRRFVPVSAVPPPANSAQSNPAGLDAPAQASGAIGAADEPAQSDPIAEGIPPGTATQFGGLFYLLNAALGLGLYGDFTAPRAANLALSPWNWLALIGRSWFGAPFENDPVWKVLAALAGRSGKEPPDHEFTAPTMWIIDPAWLRPWGGVASLHYRATRTRVRVLHPAGFVLIDVPREGHTSPMAQARHLCRTYDSLRDAVIAPTVSIARREPRSGTARWMARLLPYIEARLARSLGAEPNTDVPTLVCRHDARVVWSLTAVDVYLSLSALPLAIRVAGLDRDPGWIPAAGRAVAFHFA